ncbi:unnamed protein product [Urochloa humidicola]
MKRQLQKRLGSASVPAAKIHLELGLLRLVGAGILAPPRRCRGGLASSCHRCLPHRGEARRGGADRPAEEKTERARRQNQNSPGPPVTRSPCDQTPRRRAEERRSGLKEEGTEAIRPRRLLFRPPRAGEKVAAVLLQVSGPSSR